MKFVCMGQGLPLSPIFLTGSPLGFFKWILDTAEASVSAPETVPEPVVADPEPEVVVGSVPDPVVVDAARVTAVVAPEPVEGAREMGAVVPEPVEGAREMGAVLSEPAVVEGAPVEGGVDATVDTAVVEAGVEAGVDDRGDEETVEVAGEPLAVVGPPEPGFFWSRAKPAAPRPPPLPMGP